MTREELEGFDLRKLRSIHRELSHEIDYLRKQMQRNALASSMASKRARRLFSDTLLGCRLDRRIDHLFNSIRSGNPKVPAEQVVHIIDGVVARTISRRIWIGIITLIAVIPAIGSLVLLGIQNDTMLTKLEAEESFDTQTDRKELLNMMQADRIRWVGSGANRRLENLNNYHARVRSGALSALIALEKQRWTEEEKKALPAKRYIDLRGGYYGTLVIGGHLALTPGTLTTDLSRVRFDGSDFSGSKFYNLWLDGSSFRDCTAKGATIACPSARHTDFSGMSAQGALLSWAPEIAEPFHIEKSNLDRLDLSGGKIERVFFESCSMQGTNFTNVTYDMANFSNCDLTQTKLGKADFSKSLNVFNKCLVTKTQSEEIKLPSYCYFEKTGNTNTMRIMLDFAKYKAFWEKQNK